MEPRFTFEPKPGAKPDRTRDPDFRQEPVIGRDTARLDAQIDDGDRPIYLQHEQRPIRAPKSKSRGSGIAWWLLGGFAVVAAFMIGLGWWRLAQAPSTKPVAQAPSMAPAQDLSSAGQAAAPPSFVPPPRDTAVARPPEQPVAQTPPPAPLAPPTKPELDSFPALANAPAATMPAPRPALPLANREISEPHAVKPVPSEPATASTTAPIRLRPPEMTTTPASPPPPVQPVRTTPAESLAPPSDNAVISARPSLAPAADSDTVTVDGVTYIRGREPQALGTMAEPPPSDPASVGTAPLPLPVANAPTTLTPYQPPDHTPYQPPETNSRGRALPLPNDVVILPNGQMAIPNR
jgi:hypothetical protein